MSEWQPIETAPVAGPMLVYDPARGKWNACQAVVRSPGAPWWDAACAPIEPTHWMPLPEPPEAQK